MHRSLEPSKPVRPEEPALKADPFAQLRLLDLQAVDAALDQLAHRLSTLPESLALAELVERYDDLSAQQGRLQTQLEDLAREQRKADADVEQVKARRVRNQERIDTGQVGDPKQLQAMQHEIETLARRIADLEDVELEVMERVETSQATFDAQADELTGLRGQVEATTAARDAAAEEIADQRGDAETERRVLVPQIPEPLLALYDKLRAQLGGVGVGMIAHKRCSGCRLDISATELSRMAAAPSDEVLRCEECNRILVRTNESGL